MQQGNNQNWMPLESNPQVINTFIQKMGLKTQQYSFQELLSTQQWALDMIPKPILGLLFLYELTPVQTDHKVQQSNTLAPQNSPQDLFFMKQFAMNACGTIGLFHIVLNAAKNHPNIILENSYLDKFKLQSNTKNAEERGKHFKENKDILQEHKSSANQGQSQVVQNVESHFVAFIQNNGRLYEMDGFKLCPVDHGPCTQNELLEKGVEIIKQFMQRDPDNIHFSTLVLAKTPEA